MNLLEHLPDCIFEALKKSVTPNEMVDIISQNHGIEKVIYPFFNIQILYFLKNILPMGIGTGQMDKDTKFEIDCLLVCHNSQRIGIEIKGGPSRKSYLLAGASKKENKLKILFTDIEKLKSTLKQCYNPAIKEIYFDSQIGDIIKLTELVFQKKIIIGYSLGLLLYNNRRLIEKDLYKEKLLCMCCAIKAKAQGITYQFYCKEIPTYNLFITVIGISA